MDRNATVARLCFLLTAVLTLLGTTVRAVCMLVAFDASVGYFNSSRLVALSTILYFLGVLTPIVCAILISKGALPQTLRTPNRLSAAFLWGLSLIVFAVFGLINLINISAVAVKVNTLPIWLALPAALYFILSANRQDSRYPDWLSLVGFLPIFWCIAAVADTYTDQFTAMNSPIKVGLQLGFVGLMLILTSELRFRLGKPLPRTATALLGIGSFLAMCGAVPVLIGTGAHILNNSLHMLYAAVLLCGSLYGLFMLFRYTYSASTPEPITAE